MNGQPAFFSAERAGSWPPFTVINYSAATPISGTFASLADRSKLVTLTLGALSGLRNRR